MDTERTAALAGLGILVPRPRREPDRFLHMLEEAGCRAHVAPVIDIVPLPDQGEFPTMLAAAQAVIFVSANAVKFALAALARAHMPWPPDLPCYAVGGATAETLAEAGIQAQFPRDSVDSEGLLAMAALQQVEGQRILICRGDGGRDKLARTLRQRGAAVNYVNLYRRVPSQRHRDTINHLVDDGAVRVVAIHSGAIFEAFLASLTPSGRSRAASLAFLVPGARVAALVRSAGLDNVITAAGALPEQMVEALLGWYTGAISSMG